MDLIVRALGSVTMLAAGEVESERGWFGVVAGSARCPLTDGMNGPLNRGGYSRKPSEHLGGTL